NISTLAQEIKETQNTH
ncbi:hypothetical protein X975_23819, partial [Stegodyphus mimosarum]